MPFVLAEDHGVGPASSPSVNKTGLDNALLAAISAPDDPTAGVRTGEAIIVLPSGTLQIDDYWDIENVIGIQIWGSGKTVLQLTANADFVMRLDGCRGIVRDIQIEVPAGVEVADTAFQTFWDNTGPYISTTLMLLENIRVFGAGKWVAGVAADGEDQNDHGIMRNIKVEGNWTSGESTWWQDGIQFGSGIHGNNLIHCGYGLDVDGAKRGIANHATGLATYGSRVVNCEKAFRHGTAQYSGHENVHVENCDNLLNTGSTQNPQWVRFNSTFFKTPGNAVENLVKWRRVGGVCHLDHLHIVDDGAAASRLHSTVASTGFLARGVQCNVAPETFVQLDNASAFYFIHGYFQTSPDYTLSSFTERPSEGGPPDTNSTGGVVTLIPGMA